MTHKPQDAIEKCVLSLVHERLPRKLTVKSLPILFANHSHLVLLDFYNFTCNIVTMCLTDTYNESIPPYFIKIEADEEISVNNLA